MSTFNFQDLLSKPADSHEKPKPIPAGTYNGLVTKFATAPHKTPDGKEMGKVIFSLVLSEPWPDVDTDELDTALTKEDGSKKQLNERVWTHTHYVNDENAWRLGELLVDTMGCTPDTPGAEQLQESVGKTVGVVIKQVPVKDSTKGEMAAVIDRLVQAQ
jgi:hypothetical protein